MTPLPHLPPLLRLPVTAWWRLWRWCYPQAGPVLDPVVAAEVGPARGLRASLVFLARLPLLARAQAGTERDPATRSRNPAPGSPAITSTEQHLREALIVIVVLGWTLAAVSIAVSTLVTGNVLFEYASVPGEPEIVSPYFQVAAPAALLPLVLATLILTAAWLRNRPHSI